MEDASESSASVPFPTIDRPFGIHLWPLFSRGFEAVVGYPADDFRFVPGRTPISSLWGVTTYITSYYLIILGGRYLMHGHEPFRLKGLFLMHNLFLTVVSAALLALFAEQLIPTLARHGLFFTICHREGGWTKQLVLLYYLNYLTKYVELLDTVFLFLKKKPLTFLHCYHHGATAVLCFTQLLGSTSVSWVVICLNLMVHVCMYWYYFLSAQGIRVWWKEWVTRLQIVQFLVDIGFVYFASYAYFSSTYFPAFPNPGNCAGEEFAAFAGIGVISSYLVLFVLFYLATYGKGAGPSVRKSLRRMSQTPLPDPRLTSDPSTPHRKPQTKATGLRPLGDTRSRKA